MKEKLSMIVFILVLGSSLTTALVSVDRYTAPMIQKNQEKKLRISVLESLGIEYSADNVDGAFGANVTTETNEQIVFYVSGASGDIAFEYSGSGLWGPIRGTIALTPDLTRIKGITIIHQEETPGLGGRIADAEFLERFPGRRVSDGLVIQPPGKAQAENEVDGITGATLSCKAFEQILNDEIARYVSAIEERQ